MREYIVPREWQTGGQQSDSGDVVICIEKANYNHVLDLLRNEVFRRLSGEFGPMTVKKKMVDEEMEMLLKLPMRKTE